MAIPGVVRSTMAAALALLVLAIPMVALAQTARVGYLTGAATTGAATTPGPPPVLRQALSELGWVEGQNVAIEVRAAGGQYDRLPDYAADLVRLKVDVLVTMGVAATTAARNATRTIPIVMVSAGDPVGLGLVESLARPGGNVTGLSFAVGGEWPYGKGLELLKEAVPRARRVAVLLNPANPAMKGTLDDLKLRAQSLKVQLQTLEARGPGDFDGAFAAMARERAGALLVTTEAMFNVHRERLTALAARNKLPTMYGHRAYVEVGGLMSYGPNFEAMVRRAAFFVDRVLKGARPGDLPVEQPAEFELLINARTAKVLGLTVPQSLLTRANEVIN